MINCHIGNLDLSAVSCQFYFLVVCCKCQTEKLLLINFSPSLLTLNELKCYFMLYIYFRTGDST